MTSSIVTRSVARGARLLRRALGPARRAALALTLASLLVPLAAGPPELARAERPISRDHSGDDDLPLPPPAHTGNAGTVRDHHDPDLDPDARLQIVIKSIKVLDDRDWGSGDFSFTVLFWRYSPDCPPKSLQEGCVFPLMMRVGIDFLADDNETVRLNLVLPDGKPYADRAITITPEGGLPIRADQTYGMEIYGKEEDTFTGDEDVGGFTQFLSAENNWHLGTWTERGKQENSENGCAHFQPPWPFPTGCEFHGPEDADTIVEYEVRLAPLPDLRPTRIEAVAANGTVCMDVINTGALASDPFQLALHIDDALAPNGIVQAGGLPRGNIGTYCTQTTLPMLGQHQLSVVVDEPRTLLEQSETNNRLEQSYIPRRFPGTIEDPPTAGGKATDRAPAVTPPKPTQAK